MGPRKQVRSAEEPVGSGSDPRRPDKVKEYRRPVLGPDEVPPDVMAFFSLLLGIVGMMMKNKLASWFAVAFCASSLVNLKIAEADVKQIMLSCTFSVMGLILNYLQPNRTF